MFALPAYASVIRRVILRTPNAELLSGFYTALLGLIPHQDSGDGKIVSLQHPTTGAVLVTLHEDQTARHAPAQAPGLFHIAFLFADYEHWRSVVKRALTLANGFYGASDHGVSWAVYLTDPDGNGIELAWDKPAAGWPWHGDQIRMVTLPLPLHGIIEGADIAADCIGDFGIGHLHLQVGNLQQARVYQERLGFHITQADYPGALFMARDRYHHHLAINTWRTKLLVFRPENAMGLIGWDITGPAHATTETWHHPDGYQIHLISPHA